ncbi:interleukin-1 receptor accessory protein-like [Channa argus]|uniref:interleukin-1 receptor accessory protein-like n=1 Tax=Channa argus TaxID=215402 RepID=UPI003522E2F2
MSFSLTIKQLFRNMSSKKRNPHVFYVLGIEYMRGGMGSNLCINGTPKLRSSEKPLSVGVNMKLLSVIKALGYLSLLLTEGFTVSEDGSPEIIGRDKVQIKTQPGEMLVIHCDALTNCEDGVTLIYWLINGSFPDEITSSDRMVESERSTLEAKVLQSSLLLKNVTSEDLRSTFICVVTSTAGMAQKHITLTRRSDNRKVAKQIRRMKKGISPSRVLSHF